MPNKKAEEAEDLVMAAEVKSGAALSSPLEEFQTVSRTRTSFLGHPPGLGWLSMSEVWERFSYYGMQSLLVLYLTEYLFKPGRIAHVWGFAPFARAIEWAYGPLSPQALASAIFGLYAGLVFVTPLAGGWLADRILGRTRTVTIGAVLMAMGHFLMAFEVSLLPALLCLLVGVGCFKGNIAAQVGDLYAEDDPRRADGFMIYFLGIQLAVIVAPLICGTLGQTVGWDWGFGAAGVGMVIGLATYLVGRPSMPPEPARQATVKRAPLSAKDWRVIAVLVALLPVLALSLVSNQEIFNAYLIWAQKNYQLVFFGRTMPITWMLSVDAFVSTGMMAFVIWFWRWWATRWREPDEITKIVIGTSITACAPLILAAASWRVAQTGHPVSIYWAFGFHFINDLGFSMVLPTGLALYSRAAPKGLSGTMIAVYYLHLFVGNMLVGYIGGLLSTMPAVNFWLLHAALMVTAAVLLTGARFMFAPILAASFDRP
ncbi:MAG: peptide MFS transporter [Alphaproteobacteria bacterium]|nr:peptide MFS transporter [Alphaproteobacteria bacterium]